MLQAFQILWRPENISCEIKKVVKMRLSKVFLAPLCSLLAAKTCLDVRHALIIGYLHIVLSLWKYELLTIQNVCLHLQIYPRDRLDLDCTWEYCQKKGFYNKNFKILTWDKKSMINIGKHWYLRLGISARIGKKMADCSQHILLITFNVV